MKKTLGKGKHLGNKSKEEIEDIIDKTKDKIAVRKLTNLINNMGEDDPKVENDELKARLSALNVDPERYIFTHHILRDWVLEDCGEISAISHFILAGKMTNKFPDLWTIMGCKQEILNKNILKPMLYNVGGKSNFFVMEMPPPELLHEVSWIGFESFVCRNFYTLEKIWDDNYTFCKWTQGQDEKPQYHYIKENVENTLEGFLLAIKEEIN